MYSLKKLPEEALFGLIQQKNESAISELLERYKKQFYTYVVIMIKDQHAAEDIFQDACIKIIQSIRLGKYQEDGRFVQWASRIIRNMCMDYLKSYKRKKMVHVPDGVDIFSILNVNEKSADMDMISGQSNHRLHLMLDRLPSEQKEIIIMRFFFQMSFKEIASLLNTNVNTAMGRMRYGLLKMRAMMDQMQVII